MALEQRSQTSQEGRRVVAAGFTFDAQGLRKDLYLGDRPLIKDGMVVADGEDIKTSFNGVEGKIEITSPSGSKLVYSGIIAEVTGWKRVATIALNKADSGLSWILGIGDPLGEER